jgi:hypothetical protein
MPIETVSLSALYSNKIKSDQLSVGMRNPWIFLDFNITVRFNGMRHSTRILAYHVI